MHKGSVHKKQVREETEETDVVNLMEMHRSMELPCYIPPMDRILLVKGEANGVEQLFLIDTGASSSLASTATAELLNVVTEPSKSKVQGITGNSLRLTSKGQMEVKIGSKRKIMNMRFTDSKEVGVTSLCDIILGGDVLRSFGEIAFNIEKGYVVIGGEKIDLTCKYERDRKPRKVRSLEDKVIPPGQVMLLNVVVEDDGRDRKEGEEYLDDSGRERGEGPGGELGGGEAISHTARSGRLRGEHGGDDHGEQYDEGTNHHKGEGGYRNGE